MDVTRIRLALHGGAGTIAGCDAASEKPYHEALRDIAGEARARMSDGASALDAVVLAASRLEDCPLFNAGHGASLNSRGDAELDASLMDGDRHRAAAVGAVRLVRNPIELCRALLENGRHVMLVGQGADAFALETGLKVVANSHFITSHRLAQLERLRPHGEIALDHDSPFGTIGVVARDAQGRLAAATSTGGMTNQWPGRLGDSAVIGAGTWADKQVAVSTTGYGEAFIRTAFARTVAARMQFGHASLSSALMTGLSELEAIGGYGGAIAIGAGGTVHLRFNSAGMYRAWADAEGPIHTAIR